MANVGGAGNVPNQATYHINQENLTSFSADQLNNMFGPMPNELRNAIFDDMSVGKALLLTSMINLDKKNDELKDIQDQLSRITSDIDFLNNETAAAREASADEKTFKMSKTAQNIVEQLGKETGQKIDPSKDPEQAIEQLGNASKRLSQKSKEISAKAQQLRTELTAFQEAMSAALQSFAKSIKAVADRT